MKTMFKWVGIAVAVLIVIGLVTDKDKTTSADAGASANQKPAEVKAVETKTAEAPVKAPPEPEPEMAVFAPEDLEAAYQNNSVAADQNFKGKWYKVKGTVTSINTDIMGNPYITLGGSNKFMQPQFSFDKKSMDALAKLSPGMDVTVACKGKGDVAKIPMSTSCELVSS